jgi:hypothetical protein
MSLRVLVILLLVLGACGSRPEQRPGSGSVPAPRAQAGTEADTLGDVVKRTFPRAVTVASVAEPFPHKLVRDNRGRVIGYVVFSDSAGTTAKGYAGMVPVQVLLDSLARPVRIYILDNSETPAYLEISYRAGLLDRLLHYDPAKPDSIDAVTLATSSSRAIAEAVTRLADRLLIEVVDGPPSSR